MDHYFLDFRIVFIPLLIIWVIEVEHVVFNFSLVSHIDQSGMMTFNKLFVLMNEKNISVYNGYF